MYTERDLSLGAFSFSGLLQKAQTAVQKIESAAKTVKSSAEQFLPPEAVQTLQTPAPAASQAVPISQSQASATSLLPSGLPVIPIVLGGAALAFFLLKRRKK